MTNTIDYDLPHKWNYFKIGSKSPAVAFRDDYTGFTYYFSYETLVAFNHTLSGLVVRSNVWGNTTGKHLNAIDGGADNADNRLYYEDFKKALENAQMAQHKTVIAMSKIIDETNDKHMRDKALADRIRLNNGYSKAGH